MPESASGSEPAEVRAFVALPRDPTWAESARLFVEAMLPVSPHTSWSRTDTWHVTVKFVGRAPAADLETFARSLALLAAAVPAGDLRTDGAAVFPPRGPTRVLGLGFARTRALEDLEAFAAAAEKEARTLGLQPEDRAFRPHVTLARMRAPWPREAVDFFRRAAAEWKFPDFEMRAGVLYGSRLARGGAVHTPIARWPFRATGEGASA